MSMKQLAEELCKSVIRKYEKWKACVINIFSEYAWVVPLKDKKGITITNAFQKILWVWSKTKQSMEK